MVDGISSIAHIGQSICLQKSLGCILACPLTKNHLTHQSFDYRRTYITKSLFYSTSEELSP